MDYEQTLMLILVNGGAARANALKAIRCARNGEITEADELMKLAEESLAKAHESQTELIQAEARGEKTEVTLLTVHTQDHLMNAMTVKDLAVEIIEEIKLRQELEEKLEKNLKGGN